MSKRLSLLGLVVLLPVIITFAALAAGQGAQPQRPDLYAMIQNAGPANPVVELTGADARSCRFVTHIFAKHFFPAFLDRWPGASNSERAALEAELRETARACLDFFEAGTGGPPAAGPVRIFLDLERGTLGHSRDPYIDPTYGAKDQEVMRALCAYVEEEGAARWGIETWSAPYRPLRSLGWGIWRTSIIAPTFQQKWGAPAVAEILDTQTVWVHNYIAQQAIGNEERYSDLNVGYQLQQIIESGAAPQEAIVVLWIYPSGWSADQTSAVCRGLARAVWRVKPSFPVHLAVASDWGMVTTEIQPPPATREELPDDTGEIIGRIWDRDVIAGFWRVFGGRPVGAGS